MDNISNAYSRFEAMIERVASFSFEGPIVLSEIRDLVADARSVSMLTESEFEDLVMLISHKHDELGWKGGRSLHPFSTE